MRHPMRIHRIASKGSNRGEEPRTQSDAQSDATLHKVMHQAMHKAMPLYPKRCHPTQSNAQSGVLCCLSCRSTGESACGAQKGLPGS
eukprot:scaffold94445_cov63-Phaeocystis_antarctica.AAC.3